MRACKAYYDNGRFVPIGLEKLPKGTRAIITLLEEPIGNFKSLEEELNELEEINKAIEAAIDEEMPPIEKIKFREVEI